MMNNTLRRIVCPTMLAMIAAMSCVKKDEPVRDVTAMRTYSGEVLQRSRDVKEINLPARMLPNENVKIYSRVSGYIKRIYVDIGSRVEAGQLLAEIDAPEQKIRIIELSERMQVAYTQYLSSKDEYDRAFELSKSPGIIAPADVIRMSNKKVSDSLTWMALQYNLKNAEEMINYLQIRSPIAGVVTARNVGAGELVGVDSRQYLFDLEDNHLLRLEVAVPETYCTAILEDKNITFTVPSMPEKVYKATFSRRSNALTENTRNELWQFDFLNQANVLKSGMYANVQMNLIRSDSTFVVPMSALITGTEKQYVIIVDSDTARFVPVQTGFYFSDKVEVFGPLRTGDFILHPATDKIAQGERIHLMEKPK